MMEQGGGRVPGRDAGAARPKRFYALASFGEARGGYALLLDGRPPRTPAKRDLILPTAEAAAAVAAEWNAQGETIDPAAMPMTRLANTALDGVAAQMGAVAAEVKTYLASDLLVYRAADPAPLVAAQHAHWDPIIAWAREAFGARLILAAGVTFATQPATALAALGEAVDGLVGTGPGAPFRLASLHLMTTLTGSALLALAVMRGRLSSADAWHAAHVDETFQEAQWGIDEEALQRRARRAAEMSAAADMGRLVA